MEKKKEIIERIREFNRFYTVLIGTLNTRFLGSDYSVTETRILFELISHGDCNAKDIITDLHIDKSYMSRIIKSFENKGLITKKVSEKDRRAYIIHLTDRGIEETQTLISRTNLQIGELISNLELDECNEICQAMDLITDYLSGNNEERKKSNE